MAFTAGKEIGKYRVESLVGEGGMGEVYRVTDVGAGDVRAMKTLRGASPETRVWERFMNEARIQSRLSHPGIAAFFEMFLYDGQPCIVMEFVEGETLQERLRRRGPLSAAEATAVLDSICDALSYLHAEGVLHRDLKSSNVKLTPEGGVKLLDFGIARFRESARLTRMGSVMGTPESLAPELLQGKLADERSEVWSVGILAYEMLTGRMPFEGGGDDELYRQIQQVDPPTPGSLRPGVPPALDQLVMRCLAKTPARRFRDCTQVRRALTESAKPAATLPPRRTLVLAGGAAALLLAGWLFFRGPSGEGETVTIEVVNGQADVYESGRQVGSTPYRLRAPRGTAVQLVLRREGYQEQVVQFDVGERKVYSYPMLPARR